MSHTPLLQVDNLQQAGAARRGRKAPQSLTDVSFQAAPGEQVAILGEQGSGKTRLARAIALIERPSGGRLLFEGQDVTRAGGAHLRGLRRSLQYLGGHPRLSLSPRLDLEGVLSEPLQVQRLGSPAERMARVLAAAQTWQLNRLLLGLRANALSATLCQRASLARAFMLEPHLLVCDDLVDRLEPGGARPLLRQVAAACRAINAAWLWTTTDPDLAREFSTRVLLLENGRLRPA